MRIASIVSIVSIVMGSLLASASAHAGGPEYRVRFLGALGGEAIASGINASGVVCGAAADANGLWQPVLWEGGSIRALGQSTPAADFYWVEALSDAGEVVGTARFSGVIDQDAGWRRDSQGQFAFVVQPLLPPQTLSGAYDVNESGAIAGSFDIRAALWTESGGMFSPTVIQFPNVPAGVDYGAALAINESGVVVGFAGDEAGAAPAPGVRAFRWTEATGIEPLVSLGGSNSWANDVNDNGEIVGTAATGDGPNDPEKAFLWRSGVVTVIGGPGGPESSNGIAINNAGQVVGFDGLAAGIGPAELHPWVWDGGAKTFLNDAAPAPAPWSIGDVHDINDAGAIVVTMINPQTLRRAPAVLLPIGCYADCDGSGGLDVFDFLCFQDAFVRQEPYADCDGNETLDVFDFLCFQDAFVAGCP